MDLLASNNFIKKVKLEPKIRNIVATTDIKMKLTIDELSQMLVKSIYEPEQFPGLIYKTFEGPTCIIFASGKIVIVGAKSESELISAENSVVQQLKRFNLCVPTKNGHNLTLNK